MSKIKVLFLAADPRSAYGQAPRLLLDVDVRQIHETLCAAKYRDALELDLRLAVRGRDVLRALNQVRPHVVHFSGHGDVDGLVLASADGTGERTADAAVLKKLFEMFRGDIRLVILNACKSLPLAEAVADIVGCAIGMRDAISDEGAITFGSSFYSAIAFGRSVQAAFDQACLELAVEHPEDRDCPELVARLGVNPARLVLVFPPVARPVPAARVPRWAEMVTVAAVLASGSFIMDRDPPDEAVCSTSRPLVAALAPRRFFSSASAAPATISSASGDKSLAEDAFASARDLYGVGNYAAALPLFQRAAEAGNAEAMGFVADMHLNGQGTARNPTRALEWLNESKKTRDPRGMNALGAAYERGEGVDRSNRWALHWYRESAEKAYAPALINIAEMYEKGLGRPVNHSQALACYRKAMEAGSVDAMVDVARYQQQGVAGDPDPKEALRLYRAAADRGSARGMVEIGLMYQDGSGATRDYAEARSWFEKGAAAGSAEAMNNLGVLYKNGWGVRKDQVEADRWFRRAVQAGSAVAASNLALLPAD